MKKHSWTPAAAAVAVALCAMTPVNAQTQSASSAGTQTTARADQGAAMQELQRAAQRLRESIQSMAQQPAGPQRDHAIRAAHEALFDTNQAMLRLPPDLRAGVSASQTGGAMMRPAPAGSTYDNSMHHLRRASDRLYGAIHAMARESDSERRNQAIREANEALLETHTAMAWAFDQKLAARAQDRQGRSGEARGSASSQGGAAAIAGGVGLNERAQLSENAGADHNVKMVFALDTGNYVSDVRVTVRNGAGQTVIDGVAQGPWLYARLPAGFYTASATYNGETATEKFTVGKRGQRVAHFRWPATVARTAGGVEPILGTGPQGR